MHTLRTADNAKSVDLSNRSRAPKHCSLFFLWNFGVYFVNALAAHTKIWRHYICTPFTASFYLRTHIVSLIHYGDSAATEALSLPPCRSAVYCLSLQFCGAQEQRLTKACARNVSAHEIGYLCSLAASCTTWTHPLHTIEPTIFG